MNPGERITIIKRIASSLSQQDWADLNLTLRQFGFGTEHEPYTGNYDYVIDMVERPNDDGKLLALNEYLHQDATSAMGPQAVGGPWAEGTFRLFLSHTSANRILAGNLRTRLGAWSVEAFVAHDTIEVSREWQDEIESALRTCDALAALLTDDFAASLWCDQEVGFCLARALVIVPLMVSGEPHGFMSKYQGLRIAEGVTPAEMADRVFTVLAAHDLTRARMAKPVVQRYSQSASFESARTNFERLKDVPESAWTSELVEIVERAPRENNQVEHAVVLPSGEPMPQAATTLLAPIRERLGMSGDDEIPF